MIPYHSLQPSEIFFRAKQIKQFYKSNFTNFDTYEEGGRKERSGRKIPCRKTGQVLEARKPRTSWGRDSSRKKEEKAQSRHPRGGDSTHLTLRSVL